MRQRASCPVVLGLAAVMLVVAGCSTATVTPSPTAAVTPVVAPRSTPTLAESAAPKSIPTLVSHTQLMNELRDFVGGNPAIPQDRRFYLTPQSKATAPVNVLDHDGPASAPFTAEMQGYVIGEEPVVDASGATRFVAYFGFEDIDRKQFYVPFDFGDDHLLAHSGNIISNSPYQQTPVALSVADFELELEKDNGEIAMIESVTDSRKLDPQDAVTKAVIAWMAQTLKAPYSRIRMNSLVKRVVNTPVTTLTSSTIPSFIIFEPYSKP